MKKSILFLGFAFWGFISNAQETSFGVKAGLNYAYINGSDVKDINPTFKYHAGAIINIGITQFFSIQPEFLYSVKGYSSDQVDLDLTYLDVPILVKLKFTDQINLHFGPQLGYLISANQKTALGEDDVKDQLRSFDLALAAGLEYEMNSGLSFGARYTFSVESIGDDYEEETTTTVNGVTNTVKTNVKAPDYKNGVIQLFAAFKF